MLVVQIGEVDVASEDFPPEQTGGHEAEPEVLDKPVSPRAGEDT